MSGGYVLDIGDRPRLRENADKLSAPREIVDHDFMSLVFAEPCLNLHGNGHILGYLFNKADPPQRVLHADRDFVERLLSSQGQNLLDEYWGSYLLILQISSECIMVLRDPSGMMPCYYRVNGWGVELSDNAHGLQRRAAQSVDRGALLRHLAGRGGEGRETCLANICELLPGECLYIRPEGARCETRWSPAEYLRTNAQISSSDLITGLKKRMRECIGAWSNQFTHILLGVSGGLDSSIVAALSNPGSLAACLTLYGESLDSDERRWAHCLTEALNLRLVETPYALEDIAIGEPLSAHVPRPSPSLFWQSIAAIHHQIEKKEGIDAHFSGNGGDAIFASLWSSAPILDHFQSAPLSLGVIQTITNVSDMTGVAMPQLVRAAWRRHRRTRHNIRSDQIEGLTVAAIRALETADVRHPWLQDWDYYRPGEREHILMIIQSQRSLETYTRACAPVHIAPLLSQPIMEYCLSIPSWRWIDQGRDRSIARDAMKDMLPAKILGRQLKGGPGSFMNSIALHNALEMKKILRGGLLVDAGIIDPIFLRYEEEDLHRSHGLAKRLLQFTTAEIWARQWGEII